MEATHGTSWGREFESLFKQHGTRPVGGHGGDVAAGPPWRRVGRLAVGTAEPALRAAAVADRAVRPGRAGGAAAGPRVRRGDVRVAILAVLADEPLNGYQVIQQIAERTDGAWRPSPGSVYPTISQLEDEGLIEGDDERGRRTLRLSDAGRAYLAEPRGGGRGGLGAVHRSARSEGARPGDDGADGPGVRVSLKPELGRVMNAVWQIITTGTDEQRRGGHRRPGRGPTRAVPDPGRPPR